jgi:5,10-methylene-tetrahydrofolate dehydrogenase/methenyl tetrahydrofolate cyclohydrolase
MDGKALAARVRGEVAADVAELGELALATILVGDDAASKI